MNHFNYPWADESAEMPCAFNSLKIYNDDKNKGLKELPGIIIVHYCWCYIVSSRII